MRALDRKLLRDLRHHRAQVLSIAAVVACGVMTVIAMRSTLGSVRWARDAYYADYRFGDVFAQLKRAPISLVRRINAIPGVGAIETRSVLDVTLDVPGLPDPATGHLVSIPTTQRPMLNTLHLRQGRWPAERRDDEAIVSDRFARENRLVVGDSLGAVINGQWRQLHIVALATSPEFVYEVSGTGFMTDNRRFGVLWMTNDAIAPAYGMRGAFNDIVLRLAPGARQADVIAQLDGLLSPYGGVGAYGRDDQPSNTVVADELEQLRVIGNVFPLFFVATAAFLLNVVLSRLIATQREEIAALKAFGYGNIAVGVHYLGFAAAAVGLGSILGVAAGIWLGSAYTGLYADVFRFPSLEHRTGWGSAVAVIAISGAAALLGAASAVWAAVRLPPAEALRPPAPARYRPLLVERFGFGHLVSPAGRMVLRNMERRPLRTLSSVIGVSLATAVLVSGFYPYDASARLIDIQLRTAQREDLSVAFSTPRSIAAARELAGIAGITRVEPFRTVAARLRVRQRVRTAVITGLDAGSTLRRLVDMHGAIHPIPPAGVVLSASLAGALGVAVGDTIIAEVTELGGAERRVIVAATLDEMLGMSAYMDRRALNALMREGDVVSGAQVSIDRGTEDRVFAAFKRYPLVAGTGSRPAMIAFVEETIRASMKITTVIVVFAAGVIALGIIYNGARIALSERGRELASLRVLGLTRREVSRLLLSEQAVITWVGIPAGCALGFGFAAILANAFAAERFRFPLVIDLSTYAVASAVVAVAAVGAAGVVRRRVAHLDLIAVLKTRE
jgi:putative ABC transport system permease protein